jgi:hypothetical protein
MPGSRDAAKGYTGPLNFPKAVKPVAKAKSKKPGTRVAAKTGKKPSTVTVSTTSKSASAKTKPAVSAKKLKPAAKKPKKPVTTDI